LSRTLRIVRWQQEMLDADTHVTQGNHLEGSPSLERPSGTASAARGVRSSGGSMQAAVALCRLRGMAPEQDPAAPELRISRPFQRSSLDGPARRPQCCSVFRGSGSLRTDGDRHWRAS
jgi:hypothetical protein